ncbi:MAG: PHP domain-containing protein [Candidatus Dormibacteria bacterium]
MLPADHHVHSEWSWDAAGGSMEECCRRADAIGLPALAFTEHADFTPWLRPEDDALAPPGVRTPVSPGGRGDLDIEGYWRCLERCRSLFPHLRLISGVELGEPHRFPAQTELVLGTHPLERILGSVHCIPDQGALVDLSTRGFLGSGGAQVERARTYFAEVLALVESAPVFAVLAHLTYPQRYWPPEGPAWSVELFEEEIRTVLGSAADAGLALESNTTRGMSEDRGMCPQPAVFRWWKEAGGRAVSLGSDAHAADAVAGGFHRAAAMLEDAGFRRPLEPTGFWLL